MIELLLKLWFLLTERERLVFCFLVVLMIIAAILELLGIALIMPVIAMLANPDLLFQNQYLNFIYRMISPSSNERFMLIICAMTAVLYLGKNIFLTFATVVQARFVFRKTASVAVDLFNSYLSAPYSYFLRKNTSEILNNINMCGSLSSGILMPVIMLFAESILIVSIFVMLLFLTPYLTMVLVLLGFVLILLFHYPFKRFNFKLGESCNRHYGYVFRDIVQTFEGIKETKVRNCENTFAELHAKDQLALRKQQMFQYIMGQIPRFSIEALVVIGGMLILIIFLLSGLAKGSMILKISIIALSMVRLMPSFSRIQYYLATIRQNMNMLDLVSDGLKVRKAVECIPQSSRPLEFKKTISIESVSFSYSDGPKLFTDLSLEIPRFASVALIGTTGCGKTTLLDNILGLLTPSSGRIMVDGHDIHDNLVAWQMKIGYVPQVIFLMDSSIRSNVAFGISERDIDDAQVWKCLEIAQLTSFVESLSDGLNTVIGERGVRLSGGQRQRIGIARALYHDPELLALDEATSALDNETEKAFVDALNALRGKLTIIMIAHRLTTVSACDIVVNMDKLRAL